MTRYLIDTSVFTFMVTDQSDCLARDVRAILDDYDTELWMSLESVRELIIAQAITMGLPLISSDQKFPFYKKQGLDLIFNKV